MNPYIWYILKVCLGISFFTIPFFLLLRNDSNFTLKRHFLLGGIFASFTFPLLSLKKVVFTEVYSTVLPMVTEPMDYSIIQTPLPVEVAGPFSIYWPTVVLALYLCGALVLLFRNIFMLLRWQSVWRKNPSSNNGVYYTSSDEIFSLFTKVFLPERLKNSGEQDAILLHEKAHIRQLHYIDLVIMELTMLFTWFNPFTWILSWVMKENHEHLADREVLEKGTDPTTYRTQLLNQVMGAPVFGLAQAFNRSSVKKRFEMMKMKGSARPGLIKLAVLVPLIIFSLGYTVGKERQEKEIKGKIVFSDTGEPAHGTSIVVRNTTLGTVAGAEGNYELELKERAEVVFSFIGYKTQSYWFNPGEYRFVVLEREVADLSSAPLFFMGNHPWINAFREYLFENLADHTIDMEKLAESGYEINFAVENDGNAKLIGVATYSYPGLSKEALNDLSNDIVRIITSSGPWTPPIKNGDPHSVNLSLKGSFWHPMKKTEKIPTEKDIMEEEEVFFVVEEMPKFNNGDPAIEFNKYIAENLHYPEEEIKNKISGRVIVQFKVATDGNLEDVKVVSGASPGLDREAVRVVESSPAWTPGRQRGKAVPLQVTVLVNFSLPTSISQAALADSLRNAARAGKYERALFKNDPTHRSFYLYIYENLDFSSTRLADTDTSVATVNFYVQKDGSLSNIYIMPSNDKDFSQAIMKVVENSPLWTPAKRNGEPTELFVSMTLRFPRPTGRTPADDDKPPSKEEVFFIVEEMPKFNNGDPAIEFRKYIAENLRYPEEEKKNKISGRVILQFKVATDGNLEDVKVIVGAGPGLDNEAVRVVESSPAWTPGRQRGKAVPVLFTFPIIFIHDPEESPPEKPIQSQSYTVNERKFPQTDGSGFLILLETKDGKIKLTGLKGCAWEELSFTPTIPYVDQNGVSRVPVMREKSDNPNLSTFLFRLARIENKIELTGMQGTNWKNLILSWEEGEFRQLINEDGVVVERIIHSL